MNFRTGQILGIVSAICLFVSTLVLILSYFAVTVKPYPYFSEEEYPPETWPEGRLECIHLAELWQWRRDFFPSQLAIDFFFAIGLLMTIHTVNCLKKIYSKTTDGKLHTVMANAFWLGAALNAVEFLQDLGTAATGDQMANLPLSCTDLQALEIAYNLGEARSIWIFSLDYIFLAIGFLLAGILSLRKKIISKWHGIVGLVNAALCIIAFGLEIAQTLNSALFVGFGVVSLFWAGIAYPAWLIYLSFILGSQWKIQRKNKA